MTLAQLFDAHKARDPTQTIKLRKAFRATAKLRLRQLRAAMRVAVVDHNLLSYSTQGALAYAPAHTRLEAFVGWIEATGGQYLLGSDWARPFIERAWRMGEAKAVRETGKAAGPDESDDLVARARNEITGILAALVQQTSRQAASIIARGTRRQQALRELFAVFDRVALPRLIAVADVTVIKAYNEAKLNCYAAGGIKHVGVHAETLPNNHRTTRMDAADRVATPEEILAEEEELVGILTAGDDKVCQRCEDWAEDSPYEIEEVRDVYPLHPRCRCAVYPWEDLRFKGEDKEWEEEKHPRVAAGSPEGGRFTSWGGAEHGEEVSEKQAASVKALAEAVPGLKNFLPYMAPDEVNRVKKANVKRMVELFTTFPVEAEEMAAVAYSGGAKRGWYRKSAKALLDVFGAVDAPRFASLLAALSPQTGVEDNAINALNTWTNWVRAGRPTDRDSIVKVLGQSVQGEKGAESILPAWINNSVTALSTPDPEAIVLSGPKVDSFAYNLRDHVNAVTLDSWMANYLGIKQALFARRQAVPGVRPGKGPMYIATAAMTRRAAEILTQRTGEKWTPAEIQETIWSWAKTLYERASADKTTVAQLLEAGSVTHKDIADTPDFAILFTQNVYRKILEEGGYGKQAAAIAASNREPDLTAGGRSSLTSAEGSGIPQDAFTRHLLKAAGRLDLLREERAKRKAGEEEVDSLDAWIEFEDYDPDEPRDPLGKWTTGGSGHPGAGYSASARIDSKGVIHTSNVYDAQRALFENRKVELKQIKQVSTLIKRLGETAAEMAEHGEKAPVFNLCNVSVEGTNLFCSEHKGIPRIKMPVIPRKQTKEFIKHLEARGYKTEKSTERADHLRATQDEIDGAKVAQSMARIDREGFYKRLVVSRDDYIVDGHHTWAAQLGVDARDGTLKGDKTVKITRVDIGIIQLLHEANAWTTKQGIQRKAAGDALDFNPDQPRVPAGESTGGQWTSGGGGIEHGMIEVPARTFVESRDVSTRQQFLSPHPAEELGQHTLLLNREGNVGISIDQHGDVQNVFNNGGPKGGAAKAMVAAIEHGGRTLDCYDGFLPSYYGQFGFKETQRMKFNPAYAPPGWDFAKYDNPDIVFMSWGGYVQGGEREAIARASSRKDWIKVERTQSYGDDWDAAKAASRDAAAVGAAVHRGAGAAPRPQTQSAGSRAGFGAGESSGGDKLLLVSEQPGAAKLDKWQAEIKARRDEKEKAEQFGDREDDQLAYMAKALKEYSDIDQLDAGRAGINVVYGGPHDSDETKLLAAVLTRFNPRQGVARITLSGGIDADAHIKALQQVVARYGSQAERIEAQIWGDDLESAIIYEKAGFKISGTTDLGMTRLVYGKEGPTAREQEAAEKLAVARKNEVESKARIAAAQLDFNPDNVEFTDADDTFELNGVKMHFAGSYTRGSAKVKIYHQHVALASVAGVTAHEIGHRKLDALRARYRDEYRDMLAEPGAPPDPQGERWWQQRGGHETVMMASGELREPYASKYPVYHQWETNVELKRDKLRKSDGVTDYSKEYWKGFEKGEIPIDKAMHETIAEMTRIKFETGKLPGSPEWKTLYKMIEENWSKMSPLERAVEQHSSEKARW